VQFIHGTLYIFIFRKTRFSKQNKKIPQTNEPVMLVVYVVKPPIKAVSVQEK
jgi:hypothetical protein